MFAPNGYGYQYFNCTIQELKLIEEYREMFTEHDFNCTIQELKQWKKIVNPTHEGKFQLHHTGIKTEGFGQRNGSGLGISIAPYRN